MMSIGSRRWTSWGALLGLAVLVSAWVTPCSATTVPAGETWTIPDDDPVADGVLDVYGTAKLEPGAHIEYGINVYAGSTVEIRGGTLGTYGLITVFAGSPVGAVTVYGTDFADGGGSLAAGPWTPSGGSDTLTGEYENGDPGDPADDINLLFFSDTPIILAEPGTANLPPVALAGQDGLIGPGGEIHPIYSSEQNTTSVLGQASDPESEPIEYRWLEGTTVLLDWTAVTTVPEAYLDLSTLPLFSAGDHVLTLEVRETTGDLLEASDTMILRILAAPEITEIAIEPTPLGSATTAVATFTDSDGGTHTATIAWTEGGTPEPASVNESEMTVTGSHTYATTGVYTVTVTVTDPNGGTASSTAYAAVYDPEAVSFTAGGGSIADAGSPYGKALFGFFIRQWGYWGPGGRLGFRWEDKCFQSTEIDYLIVSEDKSSAWFAGVGTVNGAGEYYFMAEVSDGPDGLDLIIFDQYETAGLVDLLGGRIEIRQWN